MVNNTTRMLTAFLVLCVMAAFSELVHADAQRPVWVEACGRAIGSDLDPPKEVQDRAVADAQRKAVESAVGTFVHSADLVSDRQLADEELYARVRGKVEKLVVLSLDRDKKDPNTWNCSIKALVSPVFPDAREVVHVKLSVAKTDLMEGEEAKVLYESNCGGYVYIFAVAADNSVTLLFPNSIEQDNSVRAGEGRVFPADSSPIRLEARRLPSMAGHLSQEKVRVVVTRKKEILLDKSFQEGLGAVHSKRDTGTVGDLAKKLNQLDPAEWGDAVAVYTIAPGPTAQTEDRQP